MNERIIYTSYNSKTAGQISFATFADFKDKYSMWIRSGKFPIESATLLALDIIIPGERFIDIGANIGTFTLPLIKYGCEGLAVEALAANAKLLDKALAYNELEKCEIEVCAISDKAGTVYIKGISAYGTVTDEKDGATPIPALTGDQIIAKYNFQDASIIKMDIEGQELNALKGMSEYFSNEPKADFIFEANAAHCLSQGYSVRELIGVFERNGYQCFVIVDHILYPRTVTDMQEFGLFDYYATKRNPAQILNRFKIMQVRPTLDIIQSIVKTSQMAISGYRRALARELTFVPDVIGSSPEVQDVITALKSDGNALVALEANKK